MRLVRSERRARRLDTVETPAAADAGLSMPARGLLTFVLSQDGCELEDLATMARVDVATVLQWVAELEGSGYGVLVDDVFTVSDDTTDLPGAAAAGGGDVAMGVPDVVWAALKASRPTPGARVWPGADRAVVAAARLTPQERAAIKARIDLEAAAAGHGAAEGGDPDES